MLAGGGILELTIGLVAAIGTLSWMVTHSTARRGRIAAAPTRHRRNAAFALYRDLVANAHAAILFIGHDGIVHPCNPSARKMFNVNARLPRGRRHVADLFDADDRARVAEACAVSLGLPVDDRFGVFVVAATRGRGAPSRWRCRTFDGLPFEADVSFETVDGDAWPIAIVARPPSSLAIPAAGARVNVVGWDNASTAASADVDVVSLVSHELRTPINALVGLAGVLQDREDELLDPQLRRDLRQIEQTANDMRRMVDALLDLDRIRDAPPTARSSRVDAVALARAVAAEFVALATRHGCAIEVVGDASASPIPGDAETIRRVLRNLVGNAIKHAAGASLTIGVRVGGDATTFTVADNGPGIEAARIDRLFEANADGLVAHHLGSSGLGLAICRQVLRRVGGRLDVRSTAGVGSTFIVTIPRGD